MTESEAIEWIKAVRATDAKSSNQVGMLQRKESFNLAINALEKQIPKKPIKYGVTDSNGTFHPINGIDEVPYDLCPSCETNLCTTGMFGIKNRTKYCKNCGQRLDWSVEE